MASSTSVSDLVKLFGPRAKTTRNSAPPNDESKTEEWKLRFEKERDNALRAEAELNQRRSSGKFINQVEQVSVNQQDPMDESTIDLSLTAVDTPLSHPTPFTTSLPADWESERERLYQQLRNKDEEINELRQLVEKLKKQTTEQEKTLGAVWELALNQSTPS
ncbi:kinesin heavy chain-like isoform X1 [Daphnia carinata]|uniref:kinesin heavy chain-like isoform X1 n=1 Tax=Daphnia carinata TaxID=120202 RepID=UPI00257AAEED|nr:kinesin heavy chain-like isoform X1 [Daphnia carinata]